MRKSGRAQPDPTRIGGGWAPKDQPLAERSDYEPTTVEEETDGEGTTTDPRS